MITSEIQLVITVALKKELPVTWFHNQNIPVYTLKALQSGSLKNSSYHHSGIFVLVTGAGLRASREAARWIYDNLKPLFVLNIGTCGMIDKSHALGTWIRPEYVRNKNNGFIKLDDRLLIPFFEKSINAHTLLSVDNTESDGKCSSIRNDIAIDMECYAQADVFRATPITFHCLKFISDYADQNTLSDFNKNIVLLSLHIKRVFNFIDIQNPEITVIIPVYNRESTIRRGIDSLLHQSYTPSEIIVVDDCSTDRTREILDSYGKKIKCISLSRNSGPSAARNEGIRHAGSEWIAFLDSDDCWEKDKLKKQAEYLKRYPFYQIIQSEEQWIRKGKRVNQCKHHKKPLGWIWEPSLERCLISPSGVLLRKSLLSRYGYFDENLPVCEDYDLWLKISRWHPVGLEPSRSIIKHGGHEDQLSRKYPAIDRFRVQSMLALLKKENNPSFREKIVLAATKKLAILRKGYIKRARMKEAEETGKILKYLEMV